MQKNPLTLASLFDGSGGFPYGAAFCGISSVWAAEVEPFAVYVSAKNFPHLLHFGDVTRIDGAAVPPVDIITFGSPCQDMSICGRRAGLTGEKSCLFFEAVRIIKEMRKVAGVPRFAVWENVTGALSSNGGGDFYAVQKEFAAVAGKCLTAPRPARWGRYGEILSDDFSLSWRVLDAQDFGLPQHRERIYLVADFDGGSAGGILHKPDEGGSHLAESFRAWNEARVGDHGRTGRWAQAVINQYGDAYSRFYKNFPDSAPCLVTSFPPLILDRRKGLLRDLTPKECARLQGFPDEWADPGDFPYNVAFWLEVFADYARISGTPKRTPREIKRFFRYPWTRGAEYKLWGNGVALPCVLFVLARIADFMEQG